jgi:hypothetical protein
VQKKLEFRLFAFCFYFPLIIFYQLCKTFAKKILISYTKEIKVFDLFDELFEFHSDLMMEHLDHFEYFHPLYAKIKLWKTNVGKILKGKYFSLK